MDLEKFFVSSTLAIRHACYSLLPAFQSWVSDPSTGFQCFFSFLSLLLTQNNISVPPSWLHVGIKGENKCNLLWHMRWQWGIKDTMDQWKCQCQLVKTRREKKKLQRQRQRGRERKKKKKFHNITYTQGSKYKKHERRTSNYWSVIAW